MNKLPCMLSCIRNCRGLVRTFCQRYDTSVLGDLGGGAGKGGGGGGPIREAVGPFGKLGAAREEEYFHNLQQRLLVVLKGKLDEENHLREKEINRHRKAVNDNSNLVQEIDEKLDECAKRK